MEENRLLKDINDLATRHSLVRIRTESQHFKRDFQRGQDDKFHLTSEKAVITALGKTTVVAIGEHEKYKTFEEAEEAVRQHWAAYFKARRERRSEKEKRAEARRQKEYRERRKLQNKQFKIQS